MWDACVCVAGPGEGADTDLSTHTHPGPELGQLLPHLCCGDTAWRAKAGDADRPPCPFSPSPAKSLTCLGLGCLR